MRGFVQIPIIIIILLISGGAIAAYTITNQADEASSSAKEATSSIEPSKQVSKPTPKPSIVPSPTPSPFPKDPLPENSPSPIPSPTSFLSSVKLESVSPTSGKVGDVITIKGSGFGKSSFYYPDPTEFMGGVSFYGPSGQNSGGAPSACTADWDYSCWSDNQIKVKVPGVKPGFTFQVEVTSSDGQKSNRVSFEVLN